MLRLTPQGRLVLEPAPEAAAVEPEVARRIAAGFERGSGHGLLRLGGGEVGQEKHR